MHSYTRYWKSIIASVIAIAITVVQVVQAQSSDGHWTTEDTLITVLAFLGAAGVYFKANTPPAGEPSDPNISETAQGGPVSRYHGEGL